MPLENEQIESIIKADEEVIRVLQRIRNDVLKHHKNGNIAKTTGAAVSGAGFACIVTGMIFAPFTGGISLGLTMTGLTVSVAGGVTSVGTMVALHVINKKLMKELGICLETRLRRYHRIFEIILKVQGTAHGVFTALKIARFIAINNSVFQVGSKGFSAILETLLHSAKSAMFANATKTMAAQIASKAFVVGLGGIAIAIDIVTLKRDWTRDPTLATTITNIIVTLNKTIEKNRRLLQLYKEGPRMEPGIEDNDECTICLEVIRVPEDSDIVRTPCGHLFHKNCHESWMKSCKTTPQRCANCNQDILTPCHRVS